MNLTRGTDSERLGEREPKMRNNLGKAEEKVKDQKLSTKKPQESSVLEVKRLD
jgi:hypothetical protein